MWWNYIKTAYKFNWRPASTTIRAVFSQALLQTAVGLSWAMANQRRLGMPVPKKRRRPLVTLQLNPDDDVPFWLPIQCALPRLRRSSKPPRIIRKVNAMVSPSHPSDVTSRVISTGVPNPSTAPIHSHPNSSPVLTRNCQCWLRAPCSDHSGGPHMAAV